MNTFHCYQSVRKALEDRTTTCVEITKNYLQKIKEKTHLNAFIEVFTESALNQAKNIDIKIANGNSGRLAGMVIGIKDNICYKNHKVSAASKILQNFESIYNSTVIEKLLAEDAIIIGRLNCDEFAMGSGNENSIYGPVKNPIDINKVSGGSSGGSAAAVASGLCLASLGSDTGGSIRQPASFCGVIGLKPTYSRVSRHGLIAYASSFDQIGPITNTVEDAALILEVISGRDKFDSTCSSRKVENYSKILTDKKRRKIAIIRECLEREGLDEEIKQKILSQAQKMRQNGHHVEEVSFPYLEYLVPTYYVITTAEASSNLARFDGVHFGYRSKKSKDLESTYFKSRTEGFGKEVQRRIMLGTFVLSAGYQEAYFTKAQKIRRIIQEKTKDIFKEYNFILLPTTPHTAFSLGQKQVDPTIMYLEDIFTVQANLSGNPAISLPLGQHSNGLPFGIQLIGDHFKEKGLLAFSKQIMST